jgi:hypothetical protein
MRCRRRLSPLVAYLAHEDCAVNGHVYSVAGGRVARIFVAETVGAVLADLTAEGIRDHLAQIEDADGYLVPESLNEATSIIAGALGAEVLDAESA